MRLLFRFHQVAGLFSALFIFLFLVTAAVLLFREEITWLDTDEGAPMARETLLLDLDRAIGAAEEEGRRVTYVRVEERYGRLRLEAKETRNGHGAPKLLWLGGEERLAHAEGRGSPWVRDAMRVLHLLHTQLALGRNVGRDLALFACVLCVLLVLSGWALYPAFQQRLSFGAVRHAPRRLFYADLHRKLGAITGMWLFLLALSAVMILLYGEEKSAYTQRAWQEARAEMADTPRGLAPHAALERAEASAPGCLVEAIYLPQEDAPFYAFEMRPASTREGIYRLSDWAFLAKDGSDWRIDPQPRMLTFLSEGLNLHLHNHPGLLYRILWLAFALLAIAMVVCGVLASLARCRRDTGVRGRRFLPARPTRSACRYTAAAALLTLLGFVLPMWEGWARWLGAALLFLVLLLSVRK